MKVARFLVVLSVVFAACNANPRASLTPDAECGPQVGMTGDLQSDIEGVSRWSWSGAADGGPTSLLIKFRPDQSATTTAALSGPEQWSYRVVDGEVWMSGADPGDDLQSLRTAWVFDDTEWNIASNEFYGDSTLEWCPPGE